MSQSQKNKFDLDRYREGIVTSLAILKADVRNTKETLIDLRALLREQNSRIRKNETAISRMVGMGSVIMAIFSGLITWLFKK